MSSLKDLIRALRARVPRMHQLTRELVELNSYSKNVQGVNACGAALSTAFRMWGLAARVDRGGAGSGDHLFFSTPAAASKPPILLIGHHDTVFPPGHFDGYRVADGRGFGATTRSSRPPFRSCEGARSLARHYPASQGRSA